MKFCPYCGHTLDGTEKICPFCGKNLQKEPLHQQPPPIESPMTTQNTIQSNTNKEKKRTGAGWIIFILILILLLLGIGVGAYLVYEGYIPQEQVSFLPPVVLEWLTPQKKNVSNTTNLQIPQKLYYVTYAFNIVDGMKILIISSVMEPSFPEKSNKFGAEKAFIEMLKIRYAKTYFHFLKTIRTKVYKDKVKALDDREKIKREFERDGYKVEVMEVIY
ncbi:MAG: zinc ribbon domain-containing protein [Bacteroidales bacterium]|nr:zinc ribbon domain-containing protein [Bacteroidales bacterium]